MKRKSFVVKLIMVLFFANITGLSAALDQGEGIETIENVFFSIKRMPGTRSDGVMTVYKESNDDTTCRNCEVSYPFSSDLGIRIGGEMSNMTVEWLSTLPRQRANVNIEGGRLIVISMSRVERGTQPQKNDI